MLAGGLTQTSLSRWADRIYNAHTHSKRRSLLSRDTHKAQVTLSHVVHVEEFEVSFGETQRNGFPSRTKLKRYLPTARCKNDSRFTNSH